VFPVLGMRSLTQGSHRLLKAKIFYNYIINLMIEQGMEEWNNHSVRVDYF
jgi:hypothetical protein